VGKSIEFVGVSVYGIHRNPAASSLSRAVSMAVRTASRVIQVINPKSEESIGMGVAVAMQTPRAADADAVTEEVPQEIRAVIPPRLAAPSSPGAVRQILQTDWWESAQQAAGDWQKTSALAEIWELGLVPPVQPGRPHELAGLIASAGEQLTLALAALVEAELWNAHRRDNPDDLSTLDGRVVAAAQEMVHRAMADMATHFLLAAGHALANVTVRTLALDARMHAHLLDILGSPSPVNSQNPRDWLSLNQDTVRQLRRAAKKSANPAIQTISGAATDLVLSPDWQELDQLRGSHYHRHRPQSAGLDGVPLANPWTVSNGVMTMNFGGGQYTDGDGLAADTTDLARRVMARFSSAFTAMLPTVHAVIAELQEEHGRTMIGARRRRT
jgi:hypothetical protein